jgi:hypothetical protein
MGNKKNHEELKEPIRSLSREITQKYVQELVREAIKQAMKNKTRGLNEKSVLKLEKQLKVKSDQERLEQFKEPAEEISRSIRDGSIEGNKALGKMSKILERSIKPPLPLILKLLFILVIVGAPLLLFFIVMPSLSVAPENLDLEEGVSESAQLEISNTGGGVLLWTASSDQPWISLSPKRGTNEGDVIVLVDPEDMEEGTYEGTITIESLAGTEQCPIRLVVGSPPVLAVDPLSIDIELKEGESGEEEFRISNDGGGDLEWEVSADEQWITLSPESGINSGTVNIKVDTDDLSPEEEYEGTITIESNAENEECIINLKVLPEGKDEEKPILAVDPDPLFFNLTLAEGEWNSEEFYISNKGRGELEWNIVPDTDWPSWISIDPISGTNSETITVEVDASDLIPGDYNTTFRVESNEEYEEGMVSLKVSGENEGPDLVVTSLDVTGDATVTDVRRNPDGSLFKYYIAVPLHVAIRNQGDEAAGVFNVSIEVLEETDVTGLHYRFIVPEKNNYLDPSTDAPLDPGEETAFDGEVLIHNMSSGKTVFIKAIADSCPLSDYYCVNESNEENNELTIEVDLPYLEVDDTSMDETTTFSVE